jgi:DNA polymerase-3 subunit delta
MQLRADQLASHLAKTLAPLYLLHGDEPLLVIEAGDAIRAAARSRGFSEREVLVAGAGFKWDSLMLAAGNLSLFGGDKLVDLRIPSGKPGREGGEALQRYCERLPGGVTTLITLPQLDWAARKTSWFNALAQAGVAIELNAPGLAELPDWIALRLARQEQTAERAALRIHRRPRRGQPSCCPPGDPETRPAASTRPADPGPGRGCGAERGAL